MYSKSFIGLALSTLMAYPTTHALPTDTDVALQPRQGAAEAVDLAVDIIIGAINSEAKNALMKFFGESPPTCCDGWAPDTGVDCLVNAGISQAGHHWQACYPSGTAQIYDFDVNAMNCIINLHYTQDDKCIDIAGSVCAQGYGGGLMRGAMGWWGNGHAKIDQISAVDSTTFQAAADSMLNVNISYTEIKNAAISLNVVDDKTGNLVNELDFDGHQGSDC